ncbi:MAG: hypothetical protein MUC84_00160 [Solirubrobacteraceae bacterium]|jgi:hypothetical protein|nr:hypothetical protein [Solirubrobacteraceae bacterium]
MTTVSPAVPATTPAAGRLRSSLWIDAGLSGANGAVFLIAAGPIGQALGLSTALVAGLGAFFVAYASALAFLATRSWLGPAQVRLVAAANTAWVLASAVVLASGVLDPTTAGTVWLVAQALLVLDFALLQLHAARGVSRRP